MRSIIYSTTQNQLEYPALVQQLSAETTTIKRTMGALYIREQTSKNQRRQLHFVYCLTVGGLGQTTGLGKCVMSRKAFCHELENFDQTREGW